MGAAVITRASADLREPHQPSRTQTPSPFSSAPTSLPLSATWGSQQQLQVWEGEEGKPRTASVPGPLLLTSNSSIRPELGEKKDVAWMDAEALILGWTCFSKGFSSNT